MRLGNRRTSSNVEDRRGTKFSGKKAGLGIGGVIVAGIIVWLMGGNPLDVISQSGGDIGFTQTTDYQPNAEEDSLAVFASKVLAGTEDVWNILFKAMGKTYEPPKMVLFHGAVQSACGSASSSTGPFYCSADRTVYIDLSFFEEMQRQIGAGGDFAYAYVIAHEVGHHVQNLLGYLGKVHEAQAEMSQKESAQWSVRLELQADFLAGMWAYYDNQRFASLEPGDIEEALNAASAIGDDRLQKQAQGYTVPDSFTHGTSAQRYKWLKKGLDKGTLADGDTFSLPYNQL